MWVCRPFASERAASAGGSAGVVHWRAQTASSTATRSLNGRGGTWYQRSALVNTGGSQSISTGTIGVSTGWSSWPSRSLTRSDSAMCAKPRENGCSASPAGLRVPSGNTIIE